MATLAQIPPSTSVAKADEKKLHPKKSRLTEKYGNPPMKIREPGGSILTIKSYLGEGGFGRVYACRAENGKIFAAKVGHHGQIQAANIRAKLYSEIKIHQLMNHPNIVAFLDCFDYDNHVFIILPYCSNGTVLRLLRARKRYSEGEARFHMTQILGAVHYMHSNNVIHRDLKLGNFLLDENMNIKISDFGLAALLENHSDRKRSLCGTPNYIAPEILYKTDGHSFEVDIWALGVVLYTILIGKPPFQTEAGGEVADVYHRIMAGDFYFPIDKPISTDATRLIYAILNVQPAKRPGIPEILAHPWFTGEFPAGLEEDAFVRAPDFTFLSQRQSARNFRDTKRASGLSDALAAPFRRTSLNSITEVDDSHDGLRRQAHLRASLENEVSLVLQPGSPVAELIHSARKPLHVTGAPSPRRALAMSPAGPHARDRVDRVETVSKHPLAAASEKDTAGDVAALGQKLAGIRLEGDGAENTRPGARAPSSPAPRRPLSESLVPVPAARGIRDMPSKHRSGSSIATSSSRTSSYIRKGPIVMPTSLEDAPPTQSKSPHTDSHTRRAADTLPRSHKPSASSSELYYRTARNLTAALKCATAEELQQLCNTELPRIKKLPDNVFVHAWIDYSQKYGTAYTLTDGTTGLLFNDGSSIVLAPDKQHVDHLAYHADNTLKRKNYVIEQAPSEIRRKVHLARYFDTYMAESLVQTGLPWTFVGEKTRNLDFLIKVHRLSEGVLFRTSSNVLQVNFSDHTKLLLSQDGFAVTAIDSKHRLHSYTLQEILSSDPHRSEKQTKTLNVIVSRLRYMVSVLDGLAQKTNKA